MNILYQKAKLLGRPFRNDDDDSGGGDDATGGVGRDWWESLIDPTFDWNTVDFGTEAGAYSDPEMRSEIDAIIEAGNGMTGGTNLDFLKKLPSGIWNAVKGAFQDSKGNYDFAKLGAAGGALVSLSGLGKAKPGGYQGKVPELTATRQQIKYDDPNRRAGAGGRDYFTDTAYTPSKDTAAIDAAKAASKTQAEGILAGYKPAAAPVPPATKGFKLAYEKAPATTGTTAATTGAATSGIAAALPAVPNALEIAKQTYPEIFEKGDGSPNFVGPRAGNPAVSVGPPKLNADIGQYANQQTLGFTPKATGIAALDSGESYKDKANADAYNTRMADPEYKRLSDAAAASRGGRLSMEITPEEQALNQYGGVTKAAPAAGMADMENAAKAAQAAATTPFAAGGPTMKQPRYLQGITDGMEDKINTTIDDKQPAKLSHGEFVIPADVVSHLGNGNSDAGAKKLYQMMDRLRQARTGTKKQGKQINPDKFMPGGSVGYQSGGIVSFNVGGTTSTAIDTTTSSGLAPYVGDYTTQTLGEAQAAAAKPYEVYSGPLTAGASDLQTTAFQGVKDMAAAGYTPTTFTSGTFDTAAANKYMNPYLEASLNPQMKELRRQAQINNMGSLAKAGRAGAMSGDSRNLMESEGIRNLLSKQSDVLGQGYATAYDKAMGQFNTEQGRNMDAQKESETSRKYSADYSRNLLGDMAALGKTQRDIDAEGIAADKTEFEKQRDYDKEMAQYKIGMLQKLPVGSSTTEANTNPITDYIKNSGTIIAMFKQMGLIPK